MPNAWQKEILRLPSGSSAKKGRLKELIDRCDPAIAKAHFEKIAYNVVRGMAPTPAIKQAGLRKIGVYKALRKRFPDLWNEIFEEALRAYTAEDVKVAVFKDQLEMMDVGSAIREKAKVEGDDETAPTYEFEKVSSRDMTALSEANKAAGTISKFVSTLEKKKIDIEVKVQHERGNREIANAIIAKLDSISAEMARGSLGGAAHPALPDNGDGQESPKAIEGEFTVAAPVSDVPEGGN